MAHGVDQKIENLVYKAAISSVSELHPEEPHEMSCADFEMQICIC